MEAFEASPGGDLRPLGEQVLPPRRNEDALGFEHIQLGKTTQREAAREVIDRALARWQNAVAQVVDVSRCATPVAQYLKGFGLNLQLGRSLEIAGLIGTTGGREQVALVAIEQRQRKREAHQIDPFPLKLVVLTAKLTRTSG